MIDVAAPLRIGTQRLADVPWLFDALRWTLEGGFVQHRRMLRRHVPAQSGRVLDCGCGTGIFAGCFSPQSYVGIDLCPAYIRRARCLHPQHRFQVMDACGLQFPSGSFDTVVVSGVLHHMDNETASCVLAQIDRVLAEDGTLLMWEDVPTRNPFNVVGHLVHRLDVGDHIRPGDEYLRLLAGRFDPQVIEPMRSGAMDYLVIQAQKVARRAAHPDQSICRV